MNKQLMNNKNTKCLILLLSLLPSIALASGGNIVALLVFAFLFPVLALICLIYVIHQLTQNKKPVLGMIGIIFFSSVAGYIHYDDHKTYQRYHDWSDKIAENPIYISGTEKTTDEDLKDLKSLTNLQSLSLFSSNVIGSGLVYLENIKTLRELYLGKSNINDNYIQNILLVNKLEILGLNYTDITDASIITLKQLKNLRKLEIKQTKISAAGYEELSKALPSCKIVY